MEIHYFVNNVLVIWVCMFVIIYPNVPLRCVNFTVCTLYLNKIYLKTDQNVQQFVWSLCWDSFYVYFYMFVEIGKLFLKKSLKNNFQFMIFF